MFLSLLLVASGVSQGPIRPVDLKPLEPIAVATETATIKLKPGQVKAFATSEKTRWLFSPVSSDATKDGIILREATAGTTIFAFDVDSGYFSGYKTPEPVILVAANRGAKGRYRLDKIEVSIREVEGKPVADVKIVDQTYIVADSEAEPVKPTPNPTPTPVPEPKPEPAKADKLTVVVVIETRTQTAQQGEMLYGQTRRDLEAKGHTFDIVDADDPLVKSRGLIRAVNEHGLPTAIIFDREKTGVQVPLASWKMPNVASEFKSKVLESAK